MSPNENGNDEVTEEGAATVKNVKDMDNAAGEILEAKPRGVKKRKRNGGPGTIAASKRIRDLERQLKKFGDTMPPGARKEKETELAGMRALTEERARRKKELENAKKYRMVKFFDKKKIERRLKSEDENVRHQAARDYRYVTEYPRGEKYVALYPKDGHTEESRKKVDEMRKMIEDTASGGVDVDIADFAVEKEEVNETGDDFFLTG